MRPQVAQLVALGPFPDERLADPGTMQRQADLIKDIQRPLTAEEAIALLALFGNDDYCGLSHTLVTLIESCPDWPLAEALSKAPGEWAQTLRDRLERGLHRESQLRDWLDRSHPLAKTSGLTLRRCRAGRLEFQLAPPTTSPLQSHPPNVMIRWAADLACDLAARASLDPSVRLRGTGPAGYSCISHVAEPIAPLTLVASATTKPNSDQIECRCEVTDSRGPVLSCRIVLARVT